MVINGRAFAQQSETLLQANNNDYWKLNFGDIKYYVEVINISILNVFPELNKFGFD